MQQEEKSFNEMQTVKRHFFALRNGVIADVLRKGGCPYRIIFGLNLPQIVETAAETPHSRELAERLWANTTTRESMLLAPMLVDRDDFTIDGALRWIESMPESAETADVLCHRLLRHLPYALELAGLLSDARRDIEVYTGLRLMANLVYSHPSEAKAYAEAYLAAHDGSDAPHARLARQIIDEADFVNS